MEHLEEVESPRVRETLHYKRLESLLGTLMRRGAFGAMSPNIQSQFMASRAMFRNCKVLQTMHIWLMLAFDQLSSE